MYWRAASSHLVMRLAPNRARGPGPIKAKSRQFLLSGDFAALRRSDGDAPQHLLRRRLAPLRGESLFRRKEIAAAHRVEPVAVRPMLVQRAPGIGPVVVDIAAE